MTPPSTLNWPEVYRAIWVRFREELPFSYPAVAVMSAAAAGTAEEAPGVELTDAEVTEAVEAAE